MKRLLLSFSIFVFSLSLFSQLPVHFNYQATARDADGQALVDQNLVVRIGIVRNTNIIWQEDHEVLTDERGAFSLFIGGDNAINGEGLVNSFAEIPWADGGLQLALQVDYGKGFVNLGSTFLASVPYANFALSAPSNNEATPWSMNEYGLYIEDPKINLGLGTATPTARLTIQEGADVAGEVPLIQLLNSTGQPVMEGYSNGLVINMENIPGKGIKGGFAVGGYTNYKADGVQEYLRITNDSIRFYINDEIQGKGIKGGFAVGGYTRTKAEGDPYFYVGKDQTTINGSLELAGDLVLGGTVRDLSDARLKEDVVLIENAMQLLKKIDGVYYHWNSTAKDRYKKGEEREVGLLAQEVEASFPELIYTNKEGYKMISYAKITPVLLQAIKEQEAKIEDLEAENARIKDLEQRISQLESVIEAMSQD